MTGTTLTSHAFSHDPTRARRAAEQGPVFVTEDGRPTHVLLSIGAYRRLTRRRRSLADTLSLPGLAEIDLDREIARPRERLRLDLW